MQKIRHEIYNGSDPSPVEIVEIDLSPEEVEENLKANRRFAYPSVGDQLDALWKDLNQRRLNGEKLVQDADDILNKVLSVKNKYPKPKGD